MTRKVDLPTPEQLATAIQHLRDAAQLHGHRPTVTALAQQLGLSNPTFWRRFPQEAAQIAALGGAHTAIRQPETFSPANATHNDQVAALSRENRQLKQHLEHAIANIARLTLENHQLQRDLEAATKITRLHAETH